MVAWAASKVIDNLSLVPALSFWEQKWAPYDDLTYQTALAFIKPDDNVNIESTILEVSSCPACQIMAR